MNPRFSFALLRRRPASIALFCACLLVPAVTRAAPGDLDTSFTANANDDTYMAVLEPGGKMIVGGNFSVIKGLSRKFLARLLPDGTVDTQFNATTTATVYGVTVQPDGKALVCGLSHPSFPGPIMYRLLTNGALDAGFTTPVPDNDVRCLSLRNDGVITATGFFRNISGIARSYAVRVTSTGSLDSTVLPLPNSRVACQAMLPDGKLLLGGGFSVVGGSQRYRLARLNVNGTLDGGFSTGFFEDTPTLNCIAVQPDGKILVGGTYASSTTSTRYYLNRFQSNGQADATFSAVMNDDVYSITLQCDGRMICTGRFTTVNGVARKYIARLNANGTLDANFNPNPDNDVDATTLQADGKIIVNGRFDHISGGTRGRIARLLNDPATESLTVLSPSRVQWLRGGTAPETLFVTFELSTNGGSSWTALGAGTRIAGGWERTGLALGSSGKIRARAVTISGVNNGSQGILETTASFVLVPEIALHDGSSSTAPELQDGGAQPVDFGTTRQGVPAVRPFTMVNTGTAPLHVPGVTVPAGFSVLTPPVFPVTVDPGQSVTFQVRLDAAAAGMFSGSLDIASDDADEASFNIALLARVITPEIAVSEGAAPPLTEITDGQESSVDFGMVRQTIPQSKVLTVSNPGTAPLLISGVSVPAGFSLPDLPPLPATVGVGQTLVLHLQADAAAPGLAEGSVRIESDDLDEAVFDFPVSVTVVAPEIVVRNGGPAAPEITDGQAGAVDFGIVRQAAPVIRGVLIANTGTAPLLISGVTVPAGYTVLNAPAVPLAIEAGGTLSLNVRLDAAAAGTFAGEMRIASDDIDEAVFNFPVTGTVVTPEIALHDGDAAAPEISDGQAAAVDFGRKMQGTPGTRLFTIANTGTAELLVSALTVPAGYELQGAPPLPFSVGAGQARSFQVSLTTLAVGIHAGRILLSCDDLDEANFDFPVTGEVFIPDPVATPPAVASAALNRQTGLREQIMHVTNDTTATVPAYNLVIRGLPAGVEVNNASSHRDDGSWVIYVRQPMAPHTAQDVLVEYFSPDRRPVEFTPQLSTEVVLEPPALSVPSDAAALRIETVKAVPNGLLIEFPTTPGKVYQVQYSRDGTNWQASLPSIRAAANRTQWVDRGLPRTDSSPAEQTSRFYRVAEMAP
ncbi:MAG TPA: choice-of-anchor D domain-containing protein [Verrucomicrobiales bacterium]|nr:choice-of-anchor D domain-containing protein [Verrucomicrobiales bacterium]